MINRQQFMDYVIIPALQQIGLDSFAARELVLGTALQESHLTYLKQLGGGPALGVFQMEPATHDDIWKNFLHYNGSLAGKVQEITIETHADTLIHDLKYAAAMCRIHYYRRPEAIPDQGDLEAQAAYWKQHYNTPLGAGTVEEYIENWGRGL